jgi:hypothetical protein
MKRIWARMMLEMNFARHRPSNRFGSFLGLGNWLVALGAPWLQPEAFVGSPGSGDLFFWGLIAFAQL